MKTRGIMMKIINNMESEILKYELKIDLMRKVSNRLVERGESLKVIIAGALMRNEQKQKTYNEGILTGYKIALKLMK